jgi:hypothetical protein
MELDRCSRCRGREKIGGVTNDGFVVTPESSNAFAAAVGAGIDKIIPFLSLRAIHVHDLVTRFGSGTESQLRASAWLFLSNLQVFL